MFRRMQDVPKLVYCRLQSASKHKFGVLRAWLKGRCLTAPPLSWDTLAWRPLVSYARHHWRELLSYLSRFALFVIHVFGIGWAIDDPRQMMERVAEFNNKWRTLELLHHRRFEPEWDVIDKENFFPRTPRNDIRQTIRRWVEAAIQRFPGKDFFCVAKIATHGSIRVLPRDGGGRQRTARLRKKCFMADRVTRGEVGMDVRLIPRIVEVAFSTDLVEALGCALRAEDGLNIGDPSAATCANLNASIREHDLRTGFTVQTRTEVERSSVTARWQDDFWQVRIGRELFDDSHNQVTVVMRPGFYGQTLHVKRIGEPRAFGFLFYFRDRQLCVTPIQKYVCPETVPWVSPFVLMRFNTGSTFTGSKRMACEIKGYLTAMIDKTNGSRRTIVTELLRLGAEMMLRHVEVPVLSSCFDSVLPQAATALPRNWDVLFHSSQQELRAFVHEHDQGVHRVCRDSAHIQQPRWEGFDMIM